MWPCLPSICIGLCLFIFFWTPFASQFYAATSTSMETDEGEISNHKITNSQNDYHGMDQGNNIGVATGNWGCGAFGGDPEVKTIIQWLAASQVILYF